VLAVACDHHVRFGGTSHRVDALLGRVPAGAWQCVPAAKGHRYCDWAFMRLDHEGPAPDGQAGTHWLMVRRNRRTGELAFYRGYTPPHAAGGPGRGRRPALDGRGGLPVWQGPLCLDQHQVRRWCSWYRWATLAMLAHAVLVVAALAEHTRHPHRLS
jgi:hypothetical protein